MKKMETYIGGWDFWKRVGGDWCWEKNRKYKNLGVMRVNWRETGPEMSA